MNYLILFLGSAICFYFARRQWKKNLIELKEKNQTETQGLKKVWNHFSIMLWPSYLYVLAAGLIINNLIIK